MSFVLWTTKKYFEDGEYNPILKEYQSEILEILEATGETYIDSKSVWEALQMREVVASRASVINFLKLLGDLRIIRVEEVTSKGGMKSLYRFYNGANKTNIYFQIGKIMIEMISGSLKISDRQWKNLLQNLEGRDFQ